MTREQRRWWSGLAVVNAFAVSEMAATSWSEWWLLAVFPLGLLVGGIVREWANG